MGGQFYCSQTTSPTGVCSVYQTSFTRAVPTRASLFWTQLSHRSSNSSRTSWNKGLSYLSTGSMDYPNTGSAFLMYIPTPREDLAQYSKSHPITQLRTNRTSQTEITKLTLENIYHICFSILGNRQCPRFAVYQINLDHAYSR